MFELNVEINENDKNVAPHRNYINKITLTNFNLCVTSIPFTNLLKPFQC